MSDSGITELDKDWLYLIANLVSTAISNYRMLRFRTKTLSLSQQLTKNTEKTLYNHIVKIITSEITLYSNCIIRIYDNKNRKLNVVGHSGKFIQNKIPDLEFSEGVVGKVFLSKRPYIIKNLKKIQNYLLTKNGLKKTILFL